MIKSLHNLHRIAGVVFRRRDYTSIIFNVIEVTACELWRLHSQKQNKEDILARPPKQISYQKSISLIIVSWFVFGVMY